MYKNFKLSDEERQQILEQHKSYGYKHSLNEEQLNEGLWDSFWSGIKSVGKSMLNMQYGGQPTNTPTGGTVAKQNTVVAKQPYSLSDVMKGSYIRMGMKGNVVRDMQSAINNLNLSGIKLNTNGIFDQSTLEGVIATQKALNVQPKNGKYGIFGPITLKAMADHKIPDQPTATSGDTQTATTVDTQSTDTTQPVSTTGNENQVDEMDINQTEPDATATDVFDPNN